MERLYWHKPAPPAKPAEPADPPEFLAEKRERYERAIGSNCEASRLKPCPKCGNRVGVRLIAHRDHRGKRNRNQRGVCDVAGGGCGLKGPVAWSATDAERRWNDPEWREAQAGG